MCIFLVVTNFFLLNVNVAYGLCRNGTLCINGGVCVNGTCICPDGWQGDNCQYCGGKVR